MERKVTNLKDIEKGELLGLISELLFENGICVIEFHKEYFFDCCTHHREYKIMYAVDVEIIFEECDIDKDYPICMSYRTITDKEAYRLDLITLDLYKTLKTKE